MSRGGIRTIEDLKARCIFDDETDCWVFDGAFECSMPRVHVYNPFTGVTACTTTTRAAWLLAGGANPAGRIVYHHKCTDTRCVNPAHLACGSRANWAKAAMKLGVFVTTPSRQAANTRNSRSRKGILPFDLVREIRMSDETGVAVAARLGVTPQVVSKIRRGESYRETVAVASVFSWAAAA